MAGSPSSSSGIVPGLAGGLCGQLSRQITAEQLHWLLSAKLVLATVLSGTRDFPGPFLAAFTFVALDELSSHWAVGRRAVLGPFLIAVILVFPHRRAGATAAIVERFRGGTG